MIDGILAYGTSLTVCCVLFHQYLRYVRVPRWRRVWHARRRDLMRSVTELATRERQRPPNP